MMNYVTRYLSPIGEITIASNGNAITGLWLEGQKYFADTLGNEYAERNLPVFEQAKLWLDLYFAGEEPNFAPPIALDSSPFRMEIWRILQEIPYGKTMTYGEIANRISKESGKKASARAVGGAVGHNPISLIVPCHRVIGANGALTGYAGGLDKKIYFLRLEGHKY